MDQPQGESLSISDAASALESSPILDQILGEEPEEKEEQSDESGDDTESKEEVEEPEESESEEESEADPEQEEPSAIESLADLAEALEQPLDTVLDNFKATVKVNGQESTVNLRELIAGYQKDADYRHNTSRLAEERRTFESGKQTELKKLEDQHLVFGKIMQDVEKMLFADVNSAELEQLRHQNPAEYAARRQDIADRQQQFQNVMHQGANAWAQNQEQQTQDRQKALSEVIQREQEALTKRIPTWSDTDRDNLTKYLAGSYGYSVPEIGQIIDHRAVDIARKAMLYDQQQAKVVETVKKVKTLPKLVKAVKAAGPVNVQKNVIKQAKQRFKSSGKVADAAKYIELQL